MTLGDYSKIDSLEIQWPGGRMQRLFEIELNEMHLIVEDMSIDVITSTDDSMEGIQFELYPNPAKKLLFIEYSLGKSSSVNISLYDRLGRKAWYMEDQFNQAGNYKEVLKIETINGVSPGLYYCVIQIGNHFLSRKLIIL
jgi:hypothetical protein